MKGAVAGWVKPFRFPEDIKEELKLEFVGSRRKSKHSDAEIDAFIRGVESAIADWRFILDMPPTRATAIKKQAGNVAEMLNDLRAALTDELCFSLDATNAGQLDWKAIDDALRTLNHAASALEARITPKGPRHNANLNTLVEMLASSYRATLGETPAIGPTATFTNFMARLCEIIAVEPTIGRDRIKGVIERCAK